MHVPENVLEAPRTGERAPRPGDDDKPLNARRNLQDEEEGVTACSVDPTENGPGRITD
jgi:hypothetical protein